MHTARKKNLYLIVALMLFLYYRYGLFFLLVPWEVLFFFNDPAGTGELWTVEAWVALPFLLLGVYFYWKGSRLNGACREAPPGSILFVVNVIVLIHLLIGWTSPLAPSWTQWLMEQGLGSLRLLNVESDAFALSVLTVRHLIAGLFAYYMLGFAKRGKHPQDRKDRRLAHSCSQPSPPTFFGGLTDSRAGR